MRLFDRTGLYVLPLFLGLLFLAASLTPTLIPRNWLIQGVLGGIVMTLGSDRARGRHDLAADGNTGTDGTQRRHCASCDGHSGSGHPCVVPIQGA